MTTSPISCSIGVFAYNEEKNIAKTLRALLLQRLETVSISEIIVVSSACSDSTDEIVKDFATKNEIVRLIQEPKRLGKSASINHFILEATSDFLVIESGDTIPAVDVIEKLVSPFTDDSIGMTGGRPIPENSSDSFVGYAVQLLWRMHHQMALINPKLGEMIAFRKVFDSIPSQSAVDEASIEALIHQNGLKTVYIPEAIIHNKGPETLKDFIIQRRRIEAGHLWLINEQNYQVSSQNSTLLIRLTIKELKSNPKEMFRLKGVMLLEFWCRFLGKYDYYIKKRNPFIWDIAKSTKDLDRK